MSLHVHSERIKNNNLGYWNCFSFSRSLSAVHGSVVITFLPFNVLLNLAVHSWFFCLPLTWPCMQSSVIVLRFPSALKMKESKMCITGLYLQFKRCTITNHLIDCVCHRNTMFIINHSMPHTARSVSSRVSSNALYVIRSCARCHAAWRPKRLAGRNRFQRFRPMSVCLSWSSSGSPPASWWTFDCISEGSSTRLHGSGWLWRGRLIIWVMLNAGDLSRYATQSVVISFISSHSF